MAISNIAMLNYQRVPITLKNNYPSLPMENRELSMEMGQDKASDRRGSPLHAACAKCHLKVGSLVCHESYIIYGDMGDLEHNQPLWLSHNLRMYRNTSYVCTELTPFIECIIPVKTNLVGDLEHVLFSIIYGIILPIDFHIFQDC